MRVLINMLVASGRKTGIGHYADQLLRALRRLPVEDEFHAFPRSLLRWCWNTGNRLRPLLDRRKTVAATHIAKPGKNGILSTLRRMGNRLVADHFYQLCQLQDFDLYHETNYIPYPTGLPTVATVHDLSLLTHPQWHPADRVKDFESRFPRALEQCSHFIAVSEFGRNELIKQCGIAEDRVTCVHNGVRRDLIPLPERFVRESLQKLGLPRQYLLHLGTLEPRKNVLMLMQTYCSLPEKFRQRWPLLLVGSWGWNTNELRAYFRQEARWRGVTHLGYIADKYLPILYNGARALVFPSFYEGFGLPPVEMMACGGAVLASTADAVAEVTAGGAFSIDANDRDGWRSALLRIGEDDDWWQSQRRGVTEIANRFTWDRCADETMRMYQRVVGFTTRQSTISDAAA